MAIGTPVNIGQTSNKTSGTTTVLTTVADAPAGSLICIGFSVEAGAIDASGNVDSVTDSAGNTYTKAVSHRSGIDSAATAGGIYYKENAAALASGGTITIDWTGAVAPVVKGVSAWYTEGIATTGALDQIGVASGTSTTPSVSTSGATAQADEITFGIIAVEGPVGGTDWTQDASPAYAAPPDRASTFGAVVESNQALLGGHFIETATGTKTYNPTIGVSREWVAVIATFKAEAGGAVIMGGLLLMGVGA